jgi:hypothetical protein
MKTLRAAFAKALNSPELLAEAKQKNTEVDLSAATSSRVWQKK